MENLQPSAEKENISPQTNIERVVGMHSEEEMKAALASHYSHIDRGRAFSRAIEREKTKEELVMIDRAEKNVNILRAKYGLPPVSFTEDEVSMVADGPKHSFHNTLAQKTIINDGPQSGTPVGFMEGLSRFDAVQHELIHAGAYQSLQIKTTGDLASYRDGMEVDSRKTGESYLTPLNEAITEENARRFTMSISKDDPDLGDLVKKKDEEYQEFINYCNRNPDHPYPKDMMSASEFLDSNVQDINPKTGHPWVEGSGYLKERQAMWKLFDKIHEKNPGAFPGKSPEEAREEIFDMVTKASFDGNIMPFGRLMNDAFGLGTFRNYGHLQTPQEIVSLIDSLDDLKRKE